jgi:peptidyl-tRNA hydrolase, PTH1 family
MGQPETFETALLAVAGLGNPGKEYDGTRHNAGFHVLDRLAVSLSVAFQKSRYNAALATWFNGAEKIILIKPLTYMNRSGEAVGAILRYLRIPARRLLVVHDDLDLALGRLRIVLKGGHGGHRGVESITQHLGLPDFPRIKLGIGRPLYGETVEQYVLQQPYREQREPYWHMIQRGADAVSVAMRQDIVAAMNQFNRKDADVDE